jgi:hypothetical protein
VRFPCGIDQVSHTQASLSVSCLLSASALLRLLYLSSMSTLLLATQLRAVSLSLYSGQASAQEAVSHRSESGRPLVLSQWSL